jgi:hypothetical protein
VFLTAQKIETNFKKSDNKNHNAVVNEYSEKKFVNPWVADLKNKNSQSSLKNTIE